MKTYIYHRQGVPAERWSVWFCLDPSRLPRFRLDACCTLSRATLDQHAGTLAARALAGMELSSQPLRRE